MNKTRKRVGANSRAGTIIATLLIMAIVVMMFEHMKYILVPIMLTGNMYTVYGVLLIAILASAAVNTIIHEGGHLAFGLLTGYKFVSFRIFSFMLVKQDNEIKLKKLHLSGTDGQCLMSPPDMVDGKIPFALYLLGGVIMNLIMSTVFLGLFFVFRDTSFVALAMLLFAEIGFFYAVLNGVPTKTSMIMNDGYNVLDLFKNKNSLRAFWVQLKVNEQNAKGVRIKDMPSEWFAVPSDENMKNHQFAAQGVLSCNQLMDMHEFEKADELMEHLLEIESAISGLHRYLLMCDRIFVELITKKRYDVLQSMFSEEQKKFMQKMKNFPTVLRTEYTYELLALKNEEKAQRILEQFEKMEKKYPYTNDVESERELMEIADEVYKNSLRTDYDSMN